MASPQNKSSFASSFDAFSHVDEIVSKPVVGSDGAASWQTFRNENHANDRHRRSTAPKAPLKRADKLGTGFSSWDEERTHEARIREKEGHAKTNAGYSVFNNKNSTEEAAIRKRKAQVEARIRPDDKEYFIPSKTFQGWKFDYVFTTRDGPGRTGYFWDGMDSINKTPQSSVTETKTIDSNASSKAKKKKRKRGKAPTIVHDPNNPMEQLQAILQRRNQKLVGITTDNTLPKGWEAARDPSTGNSYYFHRASGKRSWVKPDAPAEDTKDHEDEDSNEKLPLGWKSSVDKASGNTYFYHTDGKTTWTKPE